MLFHLFAYLICTEVREIHDAEGPKTKASTYGPAPWAKWDLTDLDSLENDVHRNWQSPPTGSLGGRRDLKFGLCNSHGD